jgi:hypothetical protein
MTTNDDRSNGLLAWQWEHYLPGHADRRNLSIHAATVPLFMLGSLALVAGAFLAWWLVPAGAAAMAGALAAQGRGHAREAVKPLPFRGPADVLARIVVEQWVTFPRFVLTGGFAAARRDGASAAR